MEREGVYEKGALVELAIT